MKKREIIITAVLWTLAAASVAHAAGNDFGLSGAAAGTGIPVDKDIPGLIANILKTALGFVGTLFLLLMIYAGFIYMTARGDEKKVSEAKKMIVGAIIGVVIIAAAYAITSFVLTAITSGTSSSSSTSAIPAGSQSCSTGGDCLKENEDGTCTCTGEASSRLSTTGKPCTAGYCTLK